MKNNNIEQKTEALLAGVLEKLNEQGPFEIVDVEYVKEGGEWYLRAYVDKEGGIAINDCEVISRSLEAELDREDFIADAYILEVSSPGLTRPLKKERDYERNLGKPVEAHLYQPQEMETVNKKGKPVIEKVKQFIGDLKAYDAETVTLDIGETQEELVTIPRKNIAVIKQYIVF